MGGAQVRVQAVRLAVEGARRAPPPRVAALQGAQLARQTGGLSDGYVVGVG
jgi:hypothetical protein